MKMCCISNYYQVLLILFIIFCSPHLTQASSPERIIKFATVAPEGSSWMKHMRAIDRKIRAETNNQIGFAFYPGGVAGDEIDVLKKIRIGQIHCAAFSGVGFGHILPMVRVLDLPFLFKDYDEIDLVHERMKSFFAGEFQKKGFELLSWAEVGYVHLFSKRPVRSLADLRGAKVWAWSGDPVAREAFMQMGVTPITLPITDVNTGLSTGMIDTVYAPPLGALALQWHSSLSHMSRWPLVHSTGALLISALFREGLPRESALLLSKEIDSGMKALTDELRRQGREALEVLIKSGIEVSPPPSPEDTEAFRRLHERVAFSLTDRLYPRDLLERIYQILQGSK